MRSKKYNINLLINLISKKEIYFLVFMLLQFIGYCQDLSIPKNIQSPNAASLGKYGDVSLSYYVGAPNISIPLYSLENNGIPLEISLSYNSTGVRVNDLPGWTGQNWSLNAGGVITRKVNWLEDEIDTSPYPDYHYNEWLNFGYFHEVAREQLNVDQWNSEDYIINNIYTGSYQNKIQIDLEPDIFTFNFMGHSGKFFMGPDGKFKVSSKSNLKVIIDTKDVEYPFGECKVPFGEGDGNTVLGCPGNGFYTYELLHKITIVDDMGNAYIFGNTDNSIEYDVDLFQHYNKYWGANAWYLTKVLDKYGNTVYAFEYERAAKYSTTFYRLTRTEAFRVEEKGGGFTLTSCAGSSGYSVGSANNIITIGNTYRHPYKGRLISQVYLKRIISDLGVINFNSTSVWAKHYLDNSDLIDDIRDNDYRDYHQNGVGANAQYYLLPEVIFGTDNEFINKFNKGRALRSINGLSKSISFTYNVGYYSTVKKRLNLQSVNINDKKYSFEYDDIESLPDFLSRKTDHWGYFNNATPINLTGFTGDYSPFQDNGAAYFASRETHPDYVKKGMLTKITYPTGGFTQFEWEANQYQKVVSDDKALLLGTNLSYAGGVRIRRIINTFSKNDKVTREFEYFDGILESKPRYFWRAFKQQDNDFTVTTSLFSTTPAIPLSNYSGYHIGYSRVREKFSDNSNIDYYYTSNNNPKYRDEYHFFSNDSDPNPNSQYSDRSLLRGHLRQKIIYDGNNNLKQHTAYKYEYDESKHSRAVIRLSYFCNGYGIGVSLGYGYKLFYFDNNLAKKETVEYVGNGYIKQKVSFDWESSTTNSAIENIGDTFLRAKTSSIYNPDSRVDSQNIIENYTYPFDFYDDTHKNLTDKRRLDIIGTQVFKDAIKVKETKLTHSKVSGKIVPDAYWMGFKNQSLKKELKYHSFNSKGQPKETSVPDGINTIYVYGYKDNYLIAKIENASYQNINYVQLVAISEARRFSQKDLISPNWFSDQVLRTRLESVRQAFPNSLVTTYTYDPMIGVTSITDPKGLTATYEYDGFNRLKHIKDHNGDILEAYEYHYKNE